MVEFKFFRVDESYAFANPLTDLIMARLEIDPATGERKAGIATIGSRQELADVIFTNPMFLEVTDKEFCDAFDSLAADVADRYREAS